MATNTIPAPTATKFISRHADDSRIELAKSILWNLSLLLVGSVICAWAINCIMLPHNFLSGGLAGLAMIIHYIFPGLSMGTLYFVLNIPIFILGWVFVGRRFFYYSIAGMLIFTGTVTWVTGPCPVDDKILAALLAGIANGVGGGFILRSLGSAGGTDIISIILLKKFSVRISTTILVFNCSVLAASAFLFSVEAVLYTMILMYVTSKLIDVVVTGLSQRKSVMIISPKWRQIAQGITHRLNRGVTEIPFRGGFTGEEGSMIYTVVTFQELSRLKELVYQEDSDPFMVVSDTLEVAGARIGNQPHW